MDRTAIIDRETTETKISLKICLDGSGKYDVDTGIPFFDHMLELFARHGLFDLSVRAKGDISIDYHHTVEDVGIVLGQAVKSAVGDKAGMNRYGFFILPMDETLVRVAIDLCNRPILVYQLGDQNARIRDFNLSLCKEFFQAFARNRLRNGKFDERVARVAACGRGRPPGVQAGGGGQRRYTCFPRARRHNRRNARAGFLRVFRKDTRVDSRRQAFFRDMSWLAGLV